MIQTQENTKIPVWTLFMYVVMIGLTFVSVPHTAIGYFVARFIQVCELVLFVVLLFIGIRDKNMYSGFNMSVVLWWLIYTIILYASENHDIGLTPIFNCLNIAIYLLLGTCYWSKNTIDSLKYVSIAFSIYIYLNAILVYLYPEGLWIDTEWIGRGDPTRYLFGNYNMTGFVCLLGIAVHAIYTSAVKKGKFSLFMLLIVSIATVSFLGSMTSVVALCLFAIVILFRNVIKHPKLLLLVFTILYIISFLVIVWFGHSIEDVSWMVNFVEGTLSKDTTFSNRTDIWANAVFKIKQSLWLGFGDQGLEWNDLYLGGSGPHNLWLMLLLRGGIILLSTFIMVLFYTIRYALHCSSHFVIFAGVVALCVLLIMSMFEVYKLVHFFVLLQIIYYSSFIEIQKNESKQMKNTEHKPII